MHWPVQVIQQFSKLIVEIGDTFMVRRTLDRLEFGELTLQKAVALLRSLGTGARISIVARHQRMPTLEAEYT